MTNLKKEIAVVSLGQESMELITTISEAESFRQLGRYDVTYIETAEYYDTPSSSSPNFTREKGLRSKSLTMRLRVVEGDADAFDSFNLPYIVIRLDGHEGTRYMVGIARGNLDDFSLTNCTQINI